jgi:mono/diheme cytochrome c family protein
VNHISADTRNIIMNRTLRILGLATFLMAIGACGHHFEPPDPDQSERMARAEAMYSADLFDTLTWDSDVARALEGNGVYAARCRRCHGTVGSGATDYTKERGLDVPSLVESAWDFTDDLDSIRRYVFVGHEGGMPSWGLAGLSVREIDGAAYYVMAQLRSDVLEMD